MDAGAAVMLGLFAFLAVSVWASSQRDQREMKYRYELYLRMVEHPGPVADEVRALLERVGEHARRRQAKLCSVPARQRLTTSPAPPSDARRSTPPSSTSSFSL